MFKVLALLVISLNILCQCQNVPNQDWGYVQVRPGAFMFWWLYGHSNHLVRDEAPIVIWLQGGPGAASTWGSFAENGPLNLQLDTRKVNWVNGANVIYVDNPVGTGYSYVLNDSLLVKTEKEIAVDLLNFLISFFSKYPDLNKNPLWIFSESFGGRMAAGLGKAIVDANRMGLVFCNFKGVSLGDSWIDPMSYVNAWGPYLYSTSEVDEFGYLMIQKSASAVQEAVNNKDWVNATNLWGTAEDTVLEYSACVSFYNILSPRSISSSARNFAKSKTSNSALRSFYYHQKMTVDVLQDIKDIMNGPIRQKLGIVPENVTWEVSSDKVFSALLGDFMIPVIDTVDYLLQNNISVNVQNGQLDLICCTPATLNWISKLRWPELSQWKSSKNVPFSSNSSLVSGFVKTHKNFKLWNILNAGHMLPKDQPEVQFYVLQQIIGKY